MRSKGPDPVRDVYILEFIGTRTRVLHHTDPGLSGLEGKVVDETRGTFLMEIEGRRLMVPKKGARFKVFVAAEGSVVPVEINGDDILYRPVDRTKKCERKRPSEADRNRD